MSEQLSRRRFLGAAGNSILGIGSYCAIRSLATEGQRGSRIEGVQIGVITYSFRSMPDGSIPALVRYCTQCGIDAVELMGEPAEIYAGVPAKPNPEEMNGGPEILSAQTEYRKKLAAWRESVSMDRFRDIRQQFNAAGIHIYAFKPATFEVSSTEGEIDYGLRAAKALGASHVTAEMPTEAAQTQRLGDAATRHGLMIAYHAHLQATPTLWDRASAQSKANAINLDIGHYVAADNLDPLEFIRAHHTRILSMHLKDRKNKVHGGANMPWGQGDTPLRQALHLMRDQQYRFPAAIELEYDIPPGSDAVSEVSKCLEFCRQALREG